MSLRQVNQNCCRGPVKGEGMSGTPKVVASAHTCCYQFGLCCHYHHCNFPHHCHFHHQYHHHWPNIYKFLPSWQSWLVNLLKFGIRNSVFDIRNSDSINFDYSIFEFRILFHYSPTPTCLIIHHVVKLDGGYFYIEWTKIGIFIPLQFRMYSRHRR